MTPLDLEKDIIIRLKKGDEKALASIFKLYHKSLCYFARQLVQNEEQAEDIVADAFLKLWQKNGDFDTLASLRGFMYIAIRNASYNYIKHMQRRSASHREIIHLMSEVEEYIESRMIRAELFQKILTEVESLPPIRRKIFKMIYVEDLSIFEIASRLNITVDTVRVQKARALHSIRAVVLRKGILVAGTSLACEIFFFSLAGTSHL